MIQFENTITIRRPVEDVFAFVVNFENLPKWNYYVVDVRKVSQGDPGEGSVFHQIRKTDEQDFRVTQFQPNVRIAVETTPNSKPRFQRQFLFEPAEQGTRIIDSWKLDAGENPLIRWLGSMRVKAAVAENLGKLRDLLETGETELQDGRKVEV